MASYGDTVTRVRAGLVEGYGGRQVRDWASATREPLSAAVYPATAREETAGRQVTTTTKRMHAHPEPGLEATDRIEWNGTTYEIDGEPELFYQQGSPHHYELVLQVIEEAAT